MKRNELLKKLRKLAKRNGVNARWDQVRGKGSHGTFHYGNKKTAIPKGDLPKGTLNGILKQLGPTPKDIT